ncbi:MAG: PrsW family glutamic-type intramembrane protease [Candidatus Moranbacteria bacterium]|nr:PrsW family glutamic-type intramembrane protease [Candidatus Moranbacteria bacterium]
MRFIKSLVFGLLAASGALCIELILSNAYYVVSSKDIAVDYFIGMTIFLLIVVLVEEISKYILLVKLYSALGSQPPKISMALVFGAGFSLVEILFFLSQTFPSHDDLLGFRLLGTPLLHIATAGIIGTLLLKKNIPAIKIIGLAFALHLAYNLSVIYGLGYVAIYSELAFSFLLLAAFNRKSIRTKV